MSSSTNGTPRMTVWIRGPVSITFSRISLRVPDPLQRVATSARSLRTLSGESKRQLYIESGRQGNEARVAGEAGGDDETGTGATIVRKDEPATPTPPVERQDIAEELKEDRNSVPQEPTETRWDRVCDFFDGFPEYLATVLWWILGVVFRKAFLISLANMLCDLFLLGLAKGCDGVYVNVSALSFVVACACGSGVVAGGCGVLTGKTMTETADEVVQLSSVFIPAIAVDITRGHIHGLSPAFTAIHALKVGGVPPRLFFPVSSLC